MSLPHQARYKLNPIYVVLVKHDIDNFLTSNFIHHMEKTTWFLPIVVVPKKNGKLCICVDFRKFNVVTKEDPYPLPFKNEVLNIVVGYESYSFLDEYSKVPRYPPNFNCNRGHLQNCICYGLRWNHLGCHAILCE
jgi:hypothetical protein